MAVVHFVTAFSKVRAASAPDSGNITSLFERQGAREHENTLSFIEGKGTGEQQRIPRTAAHLFKRINDFQEGEFEEIRVIGEELSDAVFE